MAVGKNIKYFRKKRGMTQMALGRKVGLEETPNVRIAQYEMGNRSPKEDVITKMANALDVAPEALTTDVDSLTEVMHTLFALEDKYGLKAHKTEDDTILSVETDDGIEAFSFQTLLDLWADRRRKLEKGEISQEEYDQWRYSYTMKQKPKKD